MNLYVLIIFSRSIFISVYMIMAMIHRTMMSPHIEYPVEMIIAPRNSADNIIAIISNSFPRKQNMKLRQKPKRIRPRGIITMSSGSGVRAYTKMRKYTFPLFFSAYSLSFSRLAVIFWFFDRDLSPIMPTMYPVSSPIAAPMEATKVRMIRFVFAWHAAISISG